MVGYYFILLLYESCTERDYHYSLGKVFGVSLWGGHGRNIKS